MSESKERALDASYAQIFEKNTAGAAILEDLTSRFFRNPYVKGGPEGARQTDFNSGQVEVLHYILRRINRANGVTDEPAHDEDA